MKKYFLILSVSILFLFSIYASPSFATNLYVPAPCEDTTSYCNAAGLSYDSSNCKESCIDGNYCFNSFVGTCSLQIGPQGWTCNYRYQDSPKPSCGTCGVPTCSGGTGWWCRPDNTKCSGGKVCDATNNCACPSGTSWDETKCSTITPPAPTQCSDGTLEGACCATPGTRCKKDAGNNLACQNDATCPLCTDTDGGKVSGTKGTCKDVSGGICDWRKGGCTDTCASNEIC